MAVGGLRCETGSLLARFGAHDCHFQSDAKQSEPGCSVAAAESEPHAEPGAAPESRVESECVTNKKGGV